MEALSILPSPHTFLDYDDFAFDSKSCHYDFSFDVKIDHDDEIFKEEEERREFSFACSNAQESLLTADEIFHNGEIRPLIPILNKFTPSSLQPPLIKKLFVEQRCEVFPNGSEQRSSHKRTMVAVEVQDHSSGRCGKSNSTGFSNLWKLRREQKQLRSNSDGKDAFVFLNPPVSTKCKETALRSGDVAKNEKRKPASLSSAHEKLYVMNRKRKEGDRRRSFLPYKQQVLFGFFTNVNGLSKNLHPF